MAFVFEPYFRNDRSLMLTVILEIESSVMILIKNSSQSIALFHHTTFSPVIRIVLSVFLVYEEERNSISGR